MERVIVLGASGRFGRAAAEAFSAAGWDVTTAGRRVGPGVSLATNLLDQDELNAACAGQDVIVNAINPPYPDWARAVPTITGAVIAAARYSEATVLIPGNVYNYGPDMPQVLTEDTPWRGGTKKGQIRIDMERAYAEAGVRTIVLRGGDFLDTAPSGNWFDSQIAAKSWAGVTQYPGRCDVEHAWAFLPDMARAAVGLVAQRHHFDPFEEFGFAGCTLTGDALVRAIQAATGLAQRVTRTPWGLIRLISPFAPMLREVCEMRYLWDRPHRIDGSKLQQALPRHTDTDAAAAIAASLAPLRSA